MGPRDGEPLSLIAQGKDRQNYLRRGTLAQDCFVAALNPPLHEEKELLGVARPHHPFLEASLAHSISHQTLCDWSAGIYENFGRDSHRVAGFPDSEGVADSRRALSPPLQKRRNVGKIEQRPVEADVQFRSNFPPSEPFQRRSGGHALHGPKKLIHAHSAGWALP